MLFMNKKTPIYCSLSCLFLCVAGLIVSQVAAQKLPAKLAQEQFKNIQILKGIPADQLIPSMQFISASLGVDCEYCHVHGAMEKDDKKSKRTARKMIEMTLAIDKNQFDAQRKVTCNTCHRGVIAPQPTPLVAGGAGLIKLNDANAAANQPSLPTAEQILGKYITVLGGAPALEKVDTRIQKGSLFIAGKKEAAVEIISKYPDMRLVTIRRPAGDSATGFNGGEAWQSVPGRVHFMSLDEKESAAIETDMRFPLHILQRYKEFTVAPGEGISGRATYEITAQNGGHPPLHLFFDPQSGLLLRVVSYVDSPLGYNPTQIDYEDYRPADGVKIPFRWTVAKPGSRFTIQIDQLQQNLPIDLERFAAPPRQPS